MFKIAISKSKNHGLEVLKLELRDIFGNINWIVARRKRRGTDGLPLLASQIKQLLPIYQLSIQFL